MRGEPAVAPGSSTGFRRAVGDRGVSAGSSWIEESVVFIVLATMPLTFVSVDLGNRQLSGWAWLVSLVAAMVAVATRPLSRRALAYLSPYLLFLAIGLASLAYTPVFSEGVMTLGQTAAPAAVYLVAFRIPLSSRLRTRSLQLLALVYGAMAAAILVFGFPADRTPVGYTGFVDGMWVSTRPVSISAVALFVLVNALARSRASVIGAGVFSLLVTLATGSRMAWAALALVMLISPRVFSSWHARGAALLIAAGLTPLALSLPAVQERFFFSSGGTFGDVLTLAPNVDTAGRRDVWPVLVDSCEERAFLGNGIGASYELTRQATGGSETHPHNDFIRTFCDTGVVGSVFAWGFLAAATVRNVRQWRRRHDPLPASALMAAGAFILLSMTDNVLVYPAQFLLPVFVLLAWADQRSRETAAVSG